MTTVKLSSKNQIVIPRQARELLNLKAGDEILVIPKGKIVILAAKPEDTVAALAGTGKGIYGDAKGYLRKERRAWQRKTSRRHSESTV